MILGPQRLLTGLLASLLATTLSTCSSEPTATTEADAPRDAATDSADVERLSRRFMDHLDEARVELGPLPAGGEPGSDRVLLERGEGGELAEPWLALDGEGRRPHTETLEDGELRLLESACTVLEIPAQQDLSLIVHMAPEHLVDAAGQRVAGQPVVVELDAAPRRPAEGCRTSFLVEHGLMPRQVESPAGDEDGLQVSELSFTTMNETRAVAVVIATGLEISFGFRTTVSQQEGATARLGTVRLVHRGVDGLPRQRFREVHPPDLLVDADERGLRVKPDLDRQLRDAVMAPPGTRLCWTVDIPADAALRFATGVAWSHSATPARQVRFRVRCDEDELFSGAHDPDDSGWTDHRLSLEDHVGRHELCFETTADEGPGTLWSLWGTVELTETSARPAEGPPSTIILVSVDTLRADRLGLYGYQHATSPNLDRIAESAAVHDDHVAQTGWTLPSHVSMLTGLAPEAHGVTGQMDRILDLLEVGFDPTVPTLAAALREAGWSTHAIVSAPYLDPTFGFDRGFDSYDASTISSHQRSHLDMTAPRLTRLTQALIERSGSRPLFLFVHFWDVHYDYIPPREDLAAVHRHIAEQPLDYTRIRHPFTRHVDPALIRLVLVADPTRPPPEFYRRIRDMLPRYARVNAFMQLMSHLYDGEVRTVDRHLGLVFESLERAGRGDRAVMVTGDHGESFMEHGTLGHGVDNIFAEGLIVPMILHAPGRVEPGRHELPSMTVDIAATLLEVAGLEPLPGAHGRSLLQPGQPGRLVVGHDGSFSRIQATTGHHRLLVWGAFGPDQLFDIEADPQERNDIGNSATERRAELRRALARYLLHHGRGVHVGVVGDDDPAGVVVTLESDVPLRPHFVYGAPDTGSLQWDREHRRLRLRAAPARGEIIALTLLVPDDTAIRWTATTDDETPLPTASVLTGDDDASGAEGTLDDGDDLPLNTLPRRLGDVAGAVHLWRTPAFSVRAPLTVQEETLEQLRALGYLHGHGPAEADAGPDAD